MKSIGPCILMCSVFIAQISFTDHLKNDEPYFTESIRQADSLLENGLYDSALSLYEQTSPSLATRKAWKLYQHTLNRIGYLYSSIGVLEDKKKAREAFDKALEICKNHFKPDGLEFSDTYYFLGFFEIEKDSARFFFQKSLGIRKKILGDLHLITAESYYGLGEHFRRTHAYNEALTHFRKSLEIRESLLSKDDPLLAEVCFGLAATYRNLYDYETALIYITRAIQIYENSSFRNHTRLINAYVVKANILLVTQNLTPAIRSYSAAIDKYLAINGKKGGNLAIYFENLGIAYSMTNNLTSSLACYNEALAIAEKDDPSEVPHILNLKGLLNVQKGDFKEAQELYRNIEDILGRTLPEKHYRRSLLYEDWGDLYHQAGSYDSALNYYQKAIIQIQDNYHDTNIYHHPVIISGMDHSRLYDLIYKKARTFRSLYLNQSGDIKHLDAALHLYRLANQLGDILRNNDLREGSQLFLDSYFSYDFEQGIDCAYLLYQLTGNKKYFIEVFDMMERSKYRLLFQAQKYAEKEGQLNIPEHLRMIQKKLSTQIAECKRELLREEQKPEPESRVLVDLNNALFDLVRQEEKIKEKANLSCPECRKIQYDSVFISFEEIDKMLRKTGHLLAEYYDGDSSIYVLGVNGDSCLIEKIKRDTHYQTMEYQFLKSLSGLTARDPIANYQNFTSSSHYLYKKLVEFLIDGPEQTKKNLLVVPGGGLALIPFEALMVNRISSPYTDYKSPEYLVKTLTISYAYSANFFYKSSNESKKRSGSKLMAFSYSDERTQIAASQRDNGFELPGTTEELKRIASVFQGLKKHYMGYAATESRFKKSAADFNILHLAIHGISDTANYLNSRLIFRPERDSLNDGILYASELYAMDLRHVRLAVLSACESGIGKNYTGEGMFSVARGFVYAGCPSLVMSLWKVDDRATAELMETFYHHLALGLNADEALQTAKLKYIESSDELGAYPSNWAAFIILGNSDPVVQKTRLTIYMIPVGSFLLVILVILWFRKKAIARLT